jgi:hypothetical protein
VEANTSQTGAEGLRGRLAGLVSAGDTRRREAAAKKPRRKGNDPALRLDRYLSDSRARVLHHCRLPGTRSEIGHLIVGPAAVTVVDSSHYGDGRARVGRGSLKIGRRNRRDLVDQLLTQAKGVRELLADTPYSDVEVEAALALREVEGLPTLHSFNAPRIMICGTRKIAGEASRRGPLSSRRVNALASFLERTLSS